MFRAPPLLLIVLAACASSPSPGREGREAGPLPEGRLEGGLTRALALASRADRNVLVEYYSPSCTFCRRMEQDVFASEEVRAALREVVHVRMTKGKNATPFEMRWRNAGTPTFVVLRSDGRQLGP
ncbi:MAG: hypothetical protein GF328_06740, partial [Candidatus Latescibacteria bacterium]|nr:hypothetical protein [Candidatus Latescibacterota bacterium]